MQSKEWVSVDPGPDRVAWERELAWSQLESCRGDLQEEGDREQMPRGEQEQPTKAQVHHLCPRVLTFHKYPALSPTDRYYLGKYYKLHQQKTSQQA